MRKYYLMNGVGARYDLQQSHIVLMNEVSGLGFSNSASYQRPKDGFFYTTKSEYSQPILKAAVNFISNYYENAKDFIDFIAVSNGLTLIYKPLETEYFIDVDCNVLSHAGIGGSILTMPISFAAKTPWYTETPIIVEFEPIVAENAKIYPYSFSFNYRAEATNNSTIVSPNGHFPAELTFQCVGPITNFAIQAKDSAGGIIGRMSLENCDILSGETLYFSTKAKDSGVYRILPDGIREDLISYINLSNVNFFEVPAGQNTTISISCTGQQPDTATLKIYEYYKAV